MVRFFINFDYKMRTANSAITSVCVADVQLPVADEMKVLGVVLDPVWLSTNTFWR